MTDIERKVILVRKYIFAKKGVDPGGIELRDHNCLDKLEYAYNIAREYFYNLNN